MLIFILSLRIDFELTLLFTVGTATPDIFVEDSIFMQNLLRYFYDGRDGRTVEFTK